MVKIAMLNLLFDLRYWEERSPLIVDGFKGLQPDIIALQEVSLKINTAQWLADRLGGYNVYLDEHTGANPKGLAVAILSRMPVEEHSRIPLVGEGRVLQKVLIREGHSRFIVANTHLYWSLFDDPIRIFQVRTMLKWLNSSYKTVVCADFNAFPEYRAVKLMKKRFVSAYSKIHGREPEYTFPTGLKRGPGLSHSIDRLVLKILASMNNKQSKVWRKTVDYIFVDREIKVKGCEVIMDKPAIGDKELYPSDHVGLLATLDISKPQIGS